MQAPITHDFIENAPRDLQAVLRNQQALIKWILKENFERKRLAFRAIDRSIADAGGVVLEVGLFSRAPGDDEKDPWLRDLVVYHLTDGKSNNGPYNDRIPGSPYMSMSTSPEKILNFISKRVDDKEVVIIDMDMLDIMKVKYERTTSLAKRFKFNDEEDGKTYTSPTHFLVYEHIPQCCILGYITGQAFTNIWTDKLQKMKQTPNQYRCVSLDWQEDLEGSENLKLISDYSKNPRFTSQLQPQPQTPATPPSNARFKRSISLFDDFAQDTGSPRKRPRAFAF